MRTYFARLRVWRLMFGATATTAASCDVTPRIARSAATPNPRRETERRGLLSSSVEPLSVIALPLAGLAAAAALLPIGASAYDMRVFFIPWMNAVQQRGLASLAGEFADYTPPYIYLQYLASPLVAVFGYVATIKLINLPFLVILSAAVYQITSHASGSAATAARAAAVVWVTPTILVNAFGWGQADCIYAAFAALFIVGAVKAAPATAAAMFGVALAFKAQTIFLSPLLLYLILGRQMKLWHALLVPAAYGGMMIPAAVAGRPWRELVTAYGTQFQWFSELSMHAPNPWGIIGGLDLVDYRTGLIIGAVAAAVAGLSITLTALKLHRDPQTIVSVAALSALAMPYLLPKMHDRYFFLADILTLTFAFVNPRGWIAAACMQVGSLLAYLPYFGLSSRSSVFAVLPVTCALGILLLEYTRFRSCRLDGTPAAGRPGFDSPSA